MKGSDAETAPEDHDISIINNAKVRNLTIGVNLLLLAELCVAMFFAAKDPENLTPVFFSVFLPLLIPTIIGAIIAKRQIIKHEKKT